MAHWRIAVAMVAGLAACVYAAPSPRPMASLTITGDPIQPVGAPVILKLRVLNTGAVRMSYWCSGPWEYPDASDYVAKIENVGNAGAPQVVVLANGQKPAGDGRAIELAPKRSLEFPVTPGPLATGIYRITVTGAGFESGRVVTWPAAASDSAFQVEVRHDNDLSAARDTQMIARVRANDPFARYLVATWPTRTVRDAMVADVSGDDVVAADRAADALWGDAEPAKVDGPLVARLILKHLNPPPDGCDIGLMTRLTQTSGPLPTEALRNAMAKLFLARPEGSIRKAVAAALDRPTDPAAFGAYPTLNLAGVANDVEQRNRHDAAMLGAMLDLARSADVHERKLAYRALAEFPQSQAARETIHTGLMDPDPGCQNVANTAMRLIAKHDATTQP